MPTVPRVNSPGSVATIADQTRFQTSRGADTSSIGRGLAQLGEGLGAAAKELEVDRRRNQTTRAKELEVQFRERMRQLEFGDASGTPGLFDAQGRDAVAAFPTFQDSLNQSRMEIAESTDDPEVRAAFMNSSGVLMQSSLEGAQRFELEQSRVAAQQTSAIRIQAASEQAGRHYNNDVAIVQGLAVVRDEANQIAERSGLDNEQTAQADNEAVSNFYRDVIEGSLVVRDYGRARELLDRHGSDLLQDDRAAVTEALEEGEILDQTNVETANILAQSPTTQQEAVQMAREIKDPEVQKGTVRQLANHFSAVDRDVRVGRQAALAEAYTAIEEGASADQVLRSPEAVVLRGIPGARDGLENAEKLVRQGKEFAIGPHPDVMLELGQMAPDRVLEIDPRTMKSKLNIDEYEELLALQEGYRKALSNDKNSRAAFNFAHAALARNAPEDAEFGQDQADLDDDVKARNRLVEAQMTAWRIRQSVVQGSPVTPEQIERQAGLLWTEVISDTGTSFLGVTIPFTEETQLFAELQSSLTPLQRATVSIPLGLVDEEFVESQRQFLKSEHGVENVSEEIMEALIGSMAMGDRVRFNALIGLARNEPQQTIIPTPRVSPDTGPTEEVEEEGGNFSIEGVIENLNNMLSPAEEEVPVAPSDPIPVQELEEEVSVLPPEAQEVVEEIMTTPTIDPISGAVDPDFVQAVANIESGGRPDARNPHSTATGLFQFLDATWMEKVRQHEPELLEGRSIREVLDLRKDPEVSTRIFEDFTRDNARFLTRRGVEITPGRLYLAHFLGATGASRALSADPAASVEEVMGKRVVKANPFLKGQDIAFLEAWADSKIRGS